MPSAKKPAQPAQQWIPKQSLADQGIWLANEQKVIRPRTVTKRHKCILARTVADENQDAWPRTATEKQKGIWARPAADENRDVWPRAATEKQKGVWVRTATEQQKGSDANGKQPTVRLPTTWRPKHAVTPQASAASCKEPNSRAVQQLAPEPSCPEVRLVVVPEVAPPEPSAEEEQLSVVQEAAPAEDLPSNSSCSSGHVFQKYALPLPELCEGCQWEIPAHTTMKGCRTCSLSLCEACLKSDRFAEMHTSPLALIDEKEAASDEGSGDSACFVVKSTTPTAEPLSAQPSPIAEQAEEIVEKLTVATVNFAEDGAGASPREEVKAQVTTHWDMAGEQCKTGAKFGSPAAVNLRAKESPAMLLLPSARVPLPVGPVAIATLGLPLAPAGLVAPAGPPKKQLPGADAGKDVPPPWSAGSGRQEQWVWHPATGPDTGRWFDGSTESGMTERSGPQLEGDETLIGPDGELYDIFYPGEGVPDEDHTRSDESEHAAAPQEMSGVQVPTLRQTSAEAGIADVAAYMRSAVAARYPARARFFELVQEATLEALGKHFERLALVGSAALRIDTPDSDLDAVAYTCKSCEDGSEVRPPGPTEALRQIAAVLRLRDATLRLQLVDCARVPVLTVMSDPENLSLDLTVDQPLGEWHVQWFQKQWNQKPLEGLRASGPLCRLPEPVTDSTGDSWEHGLEAAVLRCVKWWLRRRRIPVSKEGGYPSVVWTLMVLHVLRCSVFLKTQSMNKKNDYSKALLSAIAAFFDRFAEGGLTGGTLLFAGGTRAEFHPCSMPSHGFGDFSVLDPTTTGEDSAACGIEPAELAPPLPAATRLLHAYELCRAQRLSVAALTAQSRTDGQLPTWAATEPYGSIEDRGGSALRSLFAEAGEAPNTLPVVLPVEPTAVLLFWHGCLLLGILRQIEAKPGWTASFLHRRDIQSAFAVELQDVDPTTGALHTAYGQAYAYWFHPCDFVSLASLRQRRMPGDVIAYELNEEGLERWNGMRDLLNVQASKLQLQEEQYCAKRQHRKSKKKSNRGPRA